MGSRGTTWDENWDVAYRKTDPARRCLPQSEWFRTHAKDGPRSFELDAPLAEPPDGEAPPGLPEEMKRLGASKPRGTFLGRQDNSSASDTESLEESGHLSSGMVQKRVQEGSAPPDMAKTTEAASQSSTSGNSP